MMAVLLVPRPLPPRRMAIFASLTVWLSALVVAPGASVPGSEPVQVVVRTSLGDIVLSIDQDRAPITAANFLRYVDAGLYDGGTFYRTVTQDNQPNDSIRIAVIQGGVDREKRDQLSDPIRMEGTDETGLKHLDGTISMARGAPDSARGEFFICVGAQPELDEGGRRNPDGRGFAAFGSVLEGMDVVQLIHRQPVDAQTLEPPIRILTVSRASPNRFERSRRHGAIAGRESVVGRAAS